MKPHLNSRGFPRSAAAPPPSFLSPTFVIHFIPPSPCRHSLFQIKEYKKISYPLYYYCRKKNRMEETEVSRNDLMQRLKSSAGSCFDSSSQARGPHRQLPPGPSFSPEAGKRHGIPPAHPTHPPASPHPQIPSSSSSAVPSHSRSLSLSQPAFFNLDVPVEDCVTAGSPAPAPLARSSSGRVSGDGLPPRKAHRRSQSDVPFGFFQSSLPMAAIPPPAPQRAQGFLEPGRQPPQFVKRENEWDRVGDSRAEGIGERKPEGDSGDDLVDAYMNLDSLDALNSSGTEEKREDLDSRASGTKMNEADSDNEAESSVNESGGSEQFRTPSTKKKERIKRSSPVDPSPINSRHCRSISMDSFMGKLHLGDESSKLPPSLGNQMGQQSRSGSMDGTGSTFSLEFGNGEFSAAEMKKITANEKLAEMVLTDPKRVRRILANRQSAARSKERKMRYIAELEQKVQTLQTEATTLSAQLTLLQRDSTGLTSQNNELKFRLQAMEQQAQLRDALNEALTAEVQRLKLAAGEITEAPLSKSMNQQMSLNPQLFQLQHRQSQQQQHQQATQIPLFQLQPQQRRQQQQHTDATAKLESNK
ncbi:probable transcription factor PosF21 [Phoenix dactylifera]|uniref:Probable transcription factor PosF21 n=1 Tax=Phoenix dactylifera TaxID=42345 RepID=A0A8B7BGM5_PHODC|nr:probable transcription factor PosF21 [Phoenix dactylifera]